MTIKSQLDYRNWRCPECGEIVSTLAQRDTLPCPSCRSEMRVVERPERPSVRASTANGKHRALGGNLCPPEEA